MAKIVIAGDAVVVTSSVKLEDLRKVEKYRPQALVLKEDDEEIFRVGTTDGAGSVTDFGAEFGSATHDDEALASITMVFAGVPDGDVKEIVAERIGPSILMLNKVEAGLPAVLEEIAAERAAILENITVAG